MPIKGLTTREDVVPRFPEIGRLHKGDPKSPNAPGKERPYFRFTSGIQGVEDIFRQHYGDQPVGLRVLLPYPTMEENLSTWVELWTGSRMLWRANGQHTVRRWMEDRKCYSDRKADQIDIDLKAAYAQGAKATARLNILLPDLIEAGYVGTILLASTSILDCRELTANLLEGESRAIKAGADLTQMEFVLFRAMKMVATPDKKGKFPHWLCHLRPSEDWVKAQIASARRAAYSLLPEGSTPATKALPQGNYTERVQNVELPRGTTILTTIPDGPGVDDKKEPDDKADLIPPTVEGQASQVFTPPADFNELYLWGMGGKLPHFSEGKTPAAARKHIANFLEKEFKGKRVEVDKAWAALIDHDAEKRGLAVEEKPPMLTEEDVPENLNVDGFDMANVSGNKWSNLWLSMDPGDIPYKDDLIDWEYLAKFARKLGYETVTEDTAADVVGQICSALEITPF